MEERSSIVGDIVCKRDGKLTRGMLKKLSTQNTADISSRESSSQNSVIVISDSETADGDKTNDKNDTSLSVIECTSKLSSSLRQRSSKTPTVKNTRRPSIIPLDNDSSVLYLSEGTLLNGENIGESTFTLGEFDSWFSLYKLQIKESIGLILF